MMAQKWEGRNYQYEALNFIIMNPFCGLFLDPGLGKTSISLAAIRIMLRSDMIKGVLMIAPLRVAYDVWPVEIKKWANFNGLSCTILHDKKGKASLWGPKKDIYIINPEGLPWLMAELYAAVSEHKEIPFDDLWIDESTKFKSPTAKTRFKIIKTMLPLFKRRQIMTGTPAPKSYLDLWSQMFILDGGAALGKNYHSYQRKYFFKPYSESFEWVPFKASLPKIQELISPLILDMSEGDHMPKIDMMYNDITVTLPDKVMSSYKSMEQDFFMEMDDQKSTARAAAQAMGKCHQMANGMLYEDIPIGLSKEELAEFHAWRSTYPIHKAKINALKDLIDELHGKPLLVAYHYRHDLDSIREAIGKDTPYIGSGVSVAESSDIVRRWNKGEIPVLLGHPMSMGHGLNLQESSNDVAWYSLTANLELYIQFNKRVARSGVKGGVRIHHIIAKDTVDEGVLLPRLGTRAKQQQDLRNAIKSYRKNMC